MAQMKRKRRTKHRGNAAGVVETRGRTGRKPTGADRRVSAADQRRLDRQAKFDRPPTWQGAATRAGIAALFFFAVMILFFKDTTTANALALAGFMFFFYLPLGYFTDSLIYKRRMAKRAAAKKP